MASKHSIFLPITVAVVLVDQLGKWFVTSSLAIGERAPWIGDWLAWTHAPAESGAFGIFRDWSSGAQLLGFAVLSILATTVLVSFYRGLAPRELGSAAGLGAILGGIASNGVDRLRHGTGMDFLHMGSVTSESMPDFNLADLAIVLGVVTLIVELLATEMASRAAERPPH